jgi:cytidylate kinase
MTQYDTLKQLVTEAEEDIQKAEVGNRAAGTRVRKKMMEIKKAAQEIRNVILAGRDEAEGGEGGETPAQA